MNKNITKIMAATLVLVMAAAMTACSVSNTTSSTPPAPSATPAPVVTPAALAEKYEKAIIAARDEEMNKYYPVMTNANKEVIVTGYLEDAKENKYDLTPEDASANYDANLNMISEVSGIKLEDAEAYALSISMMNIKAYGIAVVKPLAGKEAAVESAMKGYVESMKKSFESYLVDQKEIADAAVVKTLSDGTIVMVISENQDAIIETIEKELAK
ncbi:MAG: DUF4358 domain-containing protein [Angelakisella sp.]